MAELTDPIPGFDPQQSLSLRAVMKEQADESAERTVRLANESPSCPRDCDDLKRVDKKAEAAHRWIFGRSEESPPVPGADTRLEKVEGFVAGLNRLKWLIIGGIVTGLGSIVVGLVLLAATLATNR